jgi:hypothetical protein
MTKVLSSDIVLTARGIMSIAWITFTITSISERLIRLENSLATGLF